MPLASDASSRVSRRQLTPPPRTAPSWMPPAVRRLRHVLPVIGSSAPGAPLSRGQASFAVRVTQIWWLSPFSFGRHAARCLHVGAGFQPAHEPPRAWTPRRLKTCGHFGKVGAGLEPAHKPPRAWTPRRLKTCGHVGRYAATSGNLWPTQKRRRGRHPRGCRPRSGACVTFFLSPGLPLPGPLCRTARRRSQR
jgi:hypothetical protein